MSKEKRRTKSKEELCKASDAFYYEIWMFNEMVEFLLTQKPQPGNPQYNTQVESFVQHMRNLIEFFYPSEKVRHDTIIAADYLSDSSKWKKEWPELIKTNNLRANKLLAHLTYDRINIDKEWEPDTIREIRNHLNGLFEKWFKDVPKDQIGEKLHNYVIPQMKLPIHPALISTGTACSPVVAVTRKLIK